MSYEHIQLIRDGHVATLKLNRPEARNAMSIAMGDEVARAVEDVRADGDIRVLVVTGEGRAFSGGGDLGMLAADAGIGEPHAGMGGPPREFYNRYLSVATLRSPPSRRSTATPSGPASASPSPATCASPPRTPSSA
jgi:enoyl-CoA hydratase/carnithine racemase